MTHRDFGRDSELQARMLATMFLLGLVCAMLIAVAIGAGAGTASVIAIAAVFFAIQLFASGPDRAGGDGRHGGVGRGRPELHAAIERLCVQANIPKPRIAVVTAPMPNAFALGRSHKTATVRATTGLLGLRSPAELEGVLAARAHPCDQPRCDGDDDRELLRVDRSADRALRTVLRCRPQPQRAGGVCGVILVSVVVYVVSFIRLRALSRYREHAADRGAAIITGRPSALSSALMKIAGTIEQIPSRDLRTAAQMNAFFILPARRKGALTGLFAAHPTLEKRIAALARLEEQLQGSR